MPKDEPTYELIDFGDGRKLERFGAWVLDRPAPGENGPPSHPDLWKSATAQYTGGRATEGTWKPAIKKWAESSVDFPVKLAEDVDFRILLSPLPSGQIGVFPEQLGNWQWIAKQSIKTPAAKVLNLFGYTGGSTLAAAVAGAEVTHVDAAKSMVARARENAVLSGLSEAPIRWIVEDAVKFCQREVKRGNFYDAVILDPPSYGHGPKGENWSIKRDLLPLLSLCGELMAGHPKFVLLTCHTPGMGAAELSAYLSDGLFGHCGQPPECGRLNLKTSGDRKLVSGEFARWPG
ncbi:class I SAM-dependent methyltransferase [Bythopirellula polymerisocia]|uniref:Ribosomal RNA large subunit methyltransferase K n=1 Tax=Bythopirellula polymerisocia TaxID=2528003 RepID=A0A5C6CZ25_9BACT|nr:class I SAM-dependent methyltransferase [Bythopirellula polymerisocia]TWU29658.1 Ribosomal RNA large subunit methyltransferase K [Bythopirellula polymerisocia]